MSDFVASFITFVLH